jgi:hypothetical protein
MGSTGDPGGEPSLALCGPVTSSPKRGAGRKGAPATHDICPARHDLYHAQYQSPFRLAVLLPGERRRRGGGGAGLRCRVAPPAESARRRRAAPCRTCGDRWWRSRLAGHHQLWDGSRRPLVGGGAACCNTTPHQTPRPVGSALTLALAGCQPGQREAIVLTVYLDLNPEQAAAAMRVSLATLRRRLDVAGQRCGPSCLQP